MSYLTALFQADAMAGSTAESLAEHVFSNVRPGHDGYPFVKLIGKDRLAIEFDMSVKPVGNPVPVRIPVSDEHAGDEGDRVFEGDTTYRPPMEVLADAHTPDPLNVPAEQEPIEPGSKDLPATEAGENAAHEDVGEGFKSWMDKGDAAKTGKPLDEGDRAVVKSAASSV